jgi:ATP-binding cassette subfamily F protein 3
MSREVLEEALCSFEGTICFVSHDRSFMDSIATKVFEVENGSVRTFLGNYSYYLWKKEQEREEEQRVSESPRPERSGPGPVTPSGGPKSKDQKRREAAARQRASRAKAAARKERLRIQDEITTAEARLEEIDIALADSAVYTDGERVKTLVNEQRRLRSEVDDLYERWAELED